MSSSTNPLANIQNPHPNDVAPVVDTRQYDDNDDNLTNWDSDTFDPHEAYYAGAELIISGQTIVPLAPVKGSAATSTDDEVPGVDLRLLEFQFRNRSTGGGSALFRIFFKAWTDVIQTMAICAMSAPAQFRYGYVNIAGAMNGTFSGFVVSALPEFQENGYTLSIEIIDKGFLDQSQNGAKMITWRAQSGRVTDIAHQIALNNSWLPCIEPSVPVNAAQNQYVQRMMTDLTFIQKVLGPSANSAVPRSWITTGTGYSPYYAWLKYSTVRSANILHFHPLHNTTSNPNTQSVRTYVWGGIQDAATHTFGTVTSFHPEFSNQAFNQLGGSTYTGASMDIWKKNVQIATNVGTDVQDTILPNGDGQLTANLSSKIRTRRNTFSHRDITILQSAAARRHFAFRDLAFTASLSVLGDPFMTNNVYITVKVVRPDAGTMLFYDWLVVDCIHTIVGGEFTTSYTLSRNPKQSETIDPDTGFGAGLVQQQSSLALNSYPTVVGKVWDPDGTN